MTSALILLGVVLSSLTIYAQEVQPDPDFNVDMIQGNWHEIGVASNHPLLSMQFPTMQMGHYMINSEADGILQITNERYLPDEPCSRYTNMGKPGSKPGIYEYGNWGYEVTLTFTKVTPDFAIMHFSLTSESDGGTVTKLIARTMDSTDEAKMMWKEFAESMGILPENIAFPSKSDGCPVD